MKTFYKSKLIPREDGLVVWTEKWHSLRETKCFHFCCDDRTLTLLSIMSTDQESLFDQFKRRFPKRKLKRIAKGSDRFASESQEKAIEKLRWLKKRQLKHMQRDTVFIKKFIATEELEDYGPGCQRVPNTVDLVCEYYYFD